MQKNTSHDEISKGFSTVTEQVNQNRSKKRKIWSLKPGIKERSSRHFKIVRYDNLFSKYKLTNNSIKLIDLIFQEWKEYRELYKSNSELSKILEISQRSIAYIKKELIKKGLCKISYSKNKKTVLSFTEKFLRQYITEEK